MIRKRTQRHHLLALLLTLCVLLPIFGATGVALSDSAGALLQPAATQTVQAAQTQAQSEAAKIFMLKTATAQALAATAAALTGTATPTATATRAPVTPTPRPVTPLAEVLVEGLNVRSGPGTNFPVVAKGALSQRFPVSGQTGNCAWLQIVLEDGSEGWISGAAAYSSLNVACSVLPGAAASQPAPTPVPQLPTATPRPAQQPQAAQPAAQPEVPVNTGAAVDGVITSFEPLGSWRRGDEPYGTISQPRPATMSFLCRSPNCASPTAPRR
jgi:hypothetical protein